MDVRCIPSLEQVQETHWDALLDEEHPLLSHAFLLAMEKHGCLTEMSGWIPRYVVIEQQGELVAAMPLYEKSNSWGEFVFDHAWADAYARYGLEYFPKLVSAIPFTPVLAQKLLVKKGCEEALYPRLLSAALGLLGDLKCQSLHLLFPAEKELGFLETQHLLRRNDCQYHWHNRDYGSFEDFLGALSSRKRKNIRRERQKVAAANISFRRLDGITACSHDWQVFTRFYNSTYDRKWGAPIFNQDFFEEAARALGQRMLLVIAERDGLPIAGALFYRSQRVLYGRHWGCSEYHDALHFETCYYQGIEYCIEQGIEVFEPGAQGAHKLARGFEASLTHSFHYLVDQRFVPAVSDFCADESEAVHQHILAEKAHSAYKQLRQAGDQNNDE